MQDVEFTIQEGKLWILGCRNGKRTTTAALKIAVEMAQEGLISKEEAVLRIEAAQLDQLLRPTIDYTAKPKVIAKGLPASLGAACGPIVFSTDDLNLFSELGKRAILVCEELRSDDEAHVRIAEGILTTRGGMTSHAAVAARMHGLPCVSGASSIHIDIPNKTLRTERSTLKEGDFVAIDGDTGVVYDGFVKNN